MAYSRVVKLTRGPRLDLDWRAPAGEIQMGHWGGCCCHHNGSSSGPDSSKGPVVVVVEGLE